MRSRHRSFCACTMLLAMLLMSPTVFADVSVTLANPSFEEPGGTGVIDNWSLIPGWSCSDSLSWITDEDVSSDGSFNAWCYDGGAWVEQITDHTILAGVTYTLKVDAIAWANANCRLQVQVRAGTSVIAEFDETNTVHPTWTEKTLQFTADAYAGQLLKIRFRNSVTLDDCAGADNFRLTYTSPDSDPPTPNPSTWSQVPTATSASSIAMTATTASDPSGVEYSFDETTGNPGGTDSGWQSSSSYTDIGLSPNTSYTYRVQTRDSLANTGSYSTSESETTPSSGGPLLEAGNFAHDVSASLNPALVPSGSGWDSDFVESGDAFKDVNGTYYWYYHAYGATFQIGLATAADPTGAWTKYGGNPLLQIGSSGSWDDGWVACPAIYKEGGTYYMFYSGGDSGWVDFEHGVATATSPNGPWTKYSGNPIVTQSQLGFNGYMCGVVKVGGTYYMYVTDAFDTQCDYGPIYVLTSTSIYGPWTLHSTPVLSPGSSGQWDDGGFSEAEVLYYDGLFHMFYGGSQLEPGNDPVSCATRSQVKESIGYAYSSDGFTFTKFAGNPAIPRANILNANAFAEVHTIIEEPYIYLVSTVRWTEDWGGRTGCPDCEDLTMQVIELGVAPDEWVEIISDDFEAGWGNWNSGGANAIRYTGGTYAHQGSAAIDLQDDTDTSVMTTNNLTLAAYAKVKVDFWYYPNSFDNAAEDFWLQISTDGGSNFTTVEEWNVTDEFVNGNFYPDSVIITGVTLTNNTQLRFRCDASGTADDVYIDQVVVSAAGAGAPDTDPPTPNPSTWSQVPTATSSSEITMTATTASDPSGVQYSFDETTGNPGATDSGWQSSPTYTDTGLSPETMYTYRVQTKDGVGNTGSYSTSESETTPATPDTDPPTPNPSTWSQVPMALGQDSITMTATTASDPNGVQYSFDETTGNPGATDSGWQSSSSYTDTGLSPATSYTYRVQTRDTLGNTGSYSTSKSATTEAVPDTDPPTPNPSTWSQVPTATSPTEITMTATTASDPNGVQYSFDETTGNPGATDSGWQSSPSYTDTGLSPDTSYTYRVQTRDLLANTGSYSTSESATTPPTGGDWIPIISDDFESGWGNWIDGGTDAIRYTGGTYAYQGNCAIDLQDDTESSVITTGNLNLSAYSELRVDFWYYPVSFDNAAEDFWLQISTDGGLNFTTVEEWNLTDEFENDDFYGGDCPFLAGPFTSNTQLRFRCDASGDADDVYIDVVDVYGFIGTDTDPPTPNPSTWSQVPIELGSNAISMTADTASDPHNVEYYFDETTGHAGGSDSGWQSSSSYTDTGLSPETTYTYRVRTRDLLANTGTYSTSKSATTTASGDFYPMSDPNNTGNWVLRSDLSDEFEGATLDEVKWWRDGENGVYMYEWPGRAPAQFDPDNIRVENGRLKIATDWDPSFDFWPTKDPDCNCWYGDPPITQAALISNNTFRYGYMEVKIKAADECSTSSFWFTGDNSELDVFEMVGDSKVYPDTDYMFEFCVHDWAQGGDGWCDGVELGWRVADNFHVYACEWDSSGLKFYADGVLVRDAPSSVIEPYWCLDEQMMLWLDSELFEWHGIPTESELPVDFEIEYVRVWQH